jgi:hypothetical protein
MLDLVNCASRELLAEITKRYYHPNGIHVETVLGALAALAGEKIVRTTGSDLPSSGWLMLAASDALIYDPLDPNRITAWTILRTFAMSAGVPEEKLPRPDVIMRTATEAIGAAPFPPLSVPSEHFPQEWSPNAAPRFRKDIWQLQARYRFTDSQMTAAICYAIGHLIVQTRATLDPAIAIQLVMEVMVGVTRMAPMVREAA